ncbi:MAG: His/Gly/Thr/Pro-type tRNA ligase C-terminal domain-containing protein, partial [Deltaproteobacteria bacterium]|nr:His/Gly/Thr/Pro-type tRNA ligase C-terminal domain-containing protein [Deltaproteobacteria bacterium]
TAKGLGSQNAIAGGGRYDNLVKVLGGPDTPGIGFAFGVERVILLLEEREAREGGCFVVAQGDERVKTAAVGLLTELRSAGIPAQAVPEKSFKAQMRRAGKSGYPFCAIIGQDELEKSLVTIKNLETSSQVQVPCSSAREKIHTLLKERKGENR